jgi:hypothetical protein
MQTSFARGRYATKYRSLQRDLMRLRCKHEKLKIRIFNSQENLDSKLLRIVVFAILQSAYLPQIDLIDSTQQDASKATISLPSKLPSTMVTSYG